MSYLIAYVAVDLTLCVVLFLLARRKLGSSQAVFRMLRNNISWFFRSPKQEEWYDLPSDEDD